jgi:hypothetical protein
LFTACSLGIEHRSETLDKLAGNGDAAALRKCNVCAHWSTNALGQLVTPSGQFTGWP